MTFPALKQPVLLTLLAGLTLIAACGGDGDTSQFGNEQSTVTILGVVVGEQQAKLEAALAPFEEATGIDVVYEGTDAFATVLPVRVAANNAPDIAMFPQPGLMTDFASFGDLVPLTEFVDRDTLATAFSQDWIDLGSVDGDIYGIWYRASVKSLVWYNPTAFNSAGYTIPTSWEELTDLSDQIVADGGVPWCLGMESGDATGWVGTDWIEDIMLRTAGADTYDRWISNELSFDAPEVQAAFEQFGEIVLNPDYVVGGTVGAISTPFGDSPSGLLSEPPQCYLHKQGNFIASFFPEGTVMGEDLAIFPLPGIDVEHGLPVLVAGDVFGAFNNTPEVAALMEYLTTTQPHEIWAELGGFISPHSQMSLDFYPDEVARQQAEILANAETIRFDASDMMPGAVGTGSFWAGVTDYVGGAPLDTVLSDIQSSWPQE